MPLWQWASSWLCRFNSRGPHLRNFIMSVFYKTEAEELRAKLDEVRRILETAVVTEGCDKGVVLLSYEGSTHPEEVAGRVVQVYDHEFFSPLGDALIAAWEATR